MSDPRLTPFSGRVAHSSLQGQIAAPEFSDGQMMRLRVPLADLRRSPDGPRDRQIVQGARLCQLDTAGEMAYVQAESDGYCGWVARAALGPDHPVTHRVRAPATHVYSKPDLKSPELASLSLNAQIQITGAEGAFLRSPLGWLPQQHLARLDQREDDPVSVAETLLGTPYLWGGNSRAGLDCSALVQLSLHACARPCPGDSDLQQAALGPALPPDTPPKRGDLLFWRGHVAWVCAPDMILHATAYSMSVIAEPLAPALARIAQTTPLAAHIRPD
jgi:cell wall-associated NlpC family hydrolase